MRSGISFSTIIGWRSRLPANNCRVPTPFCSKYSTNCCLVKGASGRTEIKKPNQDGWHPFLTSGKISHWVKSARCLAKKAALSVRFWM